MGRGACAKVTNLGNGRKEIRKRVIICRKNVQNTIEQRRRSTIMKVLFPQTKLPLPCIAKIIARQRLLFNIIETGITRSGVSSYID